ncbi:MAG: DUF5519 family protein [Anaerolineae bacterium]|nr:DUF5519 family protein [Anaerolineae bacterium]
MTVPDANKTITQTVTGWPEVTARTHRFGGTEYGIERREIGHIHGDYLVDIPFPPKVRQHLVETGRAEPHHLLADSGWVSFYLRQPEDINRAINLLRKSYELAMQQRNRKKIGEK